MKLLSAIVAAIALTGCASKATPFKTIAEQKLDRLQCDTEFAGSTVTECMAARGYSPLEVEPFPFDG